MDAQPDVDLIVGLILANKWDAVAAIVIGFLVRLLKEDTKLPWTVGPRWRPLVALGLGTLSGAARAVLTGMAWPEALLRGLVDGTIAIAGHGALVDALRNGRDVALPAWLKASTRKPEPPTPPDPSVPRA